MIDLDHLADHGFLAAPLLAPSAVRALDEAFADLGLSDDHAFFASANDPDRQLATRLNRHLQGIVGPALRTALPHHEPFLASYLSKGARTGCQISFHQDLTYTVESDARTVVVWIPLRNVDETSGTLQLVAGSHRWTTGCRPGGTTHLPTETHQAAFAACAEPVPLAAGNAIFYDAATVHGSPPNTTDQVRVAVGVALAPTGVPLVHVHASPGGAAPTAYLVDADYYADQGLENRPEGYPTTDLWAPPVRAQDFTEHLAPAPAPRVAIT